MTGFGGEGYRIFRLGSPQRRRSSAVDRNREVAGGVDKEHRLTSRHISKGAANCYGVRSSAQVQLNATAEPRGGQVTGLRRKLQVAESIDRQHFSFDLPVADYLPRRGQSHQLRGIDSWAELTERNSAGQVRRRRSEHVTTIERTGADRQTERAILQQNSVLRPAKGFGCPQQQPIVRPDKHAHRRLDCHAAPGCADSRVNHRDVDGRRQEPDGLRQHDGAVADILWRYVVGDVDDPYGRRDPGDHPVTGGNEAIAATVIGGEGDPVKAHWG
jgi:hypothetical protein